MVGVFWLMLMQREGGTASADAARTATESLPATLAGACLTIVLVVAFAVRAIYRSEKA